MKRYFNNTTKRPVRTVLALILTAGLALSVLPPQAIAQAVRPGDQETRSLLLLVREAANLIREAAALTGKDSVKDELKQARKALEDAPDKRGGNDNASATGYSLSREILRRIIEEQQSESTDFQEKVAEALRRIELAGSGEGRASVETAFGLHTATFDTLQGTVTVNLPNDLQAGDTISGSVIAEPKGKTETEQARNQSELNGYVVQIDKEQVPTEKQYAKLIIPAVATAVPVILKNRDGKEVARAQVPVDNKTRKFSPHQGQNKNETKFPGVGVGSGIDAPKAQGGVLGAYQTPSTGQAGKPIVVKGPFDGNYETSRVNIANRVVRVLAESPRQIVAQSPADVIGKADIEVGEQGKVVAKSSYRSIGVRLSAAKLNLIRGEQTTMTVTLLGAAEPDTQSPVLQGSVTVELVNHSPWVVRMSGGEKQQIVVKPREFNGGTYSTTRTLTGVQPGGFTINATVLSNIASPLTGKDGGPGARLPSPGLDQSPLNLSPVPAALDRDTYRPELPVTQQPAREGELGPDGEPRTSGSSRPVDPLRGRFRVTLNGFSVNSQTADDRSVRDGPGDEVTLVSYVATIDRGSRFNRIIWGDTFTSVIGAQPPNEIRAGRASDRGGLRTGDAFPMATPALRTTALNPGIPPTVLFEGELVQGENAAFIVPSIWEWDGLSHRELHGRYADVMDRVRSNIISFVSRFIQRPPALELRNYLLQGSVMGLGNVVTVGGEANNRPIGMLPAEGGFGFTPRVLILTYDAAREFAQMDAGRGRGVIVVHYVDDAELEGSYSLFLQIEQVDAR